MFKGIENFVTWDDFEWGMINGICYKNLYKRMLTNYNLWG